MVLLHISKWIGLFALLCACDGRDPAIGREREWTPARELPAFQEASAVVAASTGFEMWRGIPNHPTPEQVETAVRREAGLFEREPLAATSTDIDWFRAYCATGERMKQVREVPGLESVKLCGGFHADFALVFVNGSRTAEYALCFGCNEVKIALDGRSALHLELDDYAVLERFAVYWRQ